MRACGRRGRCAAGARGAAGLTRGPAVTRLGGQPSCPGRLLPPRPRRPARRRCDGIRGDGGGVIERCFAADRPGRAARRDDEGPATHGGTRRGRPGAHPAARRGGRPTTWPTRGTSRTATAAAGWPREDFEQVAYLGLVKAVDNFDPEHGTGFLGYATPMIIGEIKRYFRDATWCVHVPRRMQELTGALRKAADVLSARSRPGADDPRAGRAPRREPRRRSSRPSTRPRRTPRPRSTTPSATTSTAPACGELMGGDDPGFELIDRPPGAQRAWSRGSASGTSGSC